MTNRITVAENAGFCFGCRRAADLAEKALRDGCRLYTLGQLVHNDIYLEHLRSLGMREITAEEIPAVEALAAGGEEATVLIRAHGELEQRLKALRDAAARCPTLHLLDGTCPYVGKLRGIAASACGEGKVLLLIGQADHPEVKGVLSCCTGEVHVLPGAAALETFLASPEGRAMAGKTVSMAVQTTHNVQDWKKSWEILKKDYTNVIIFDTICSVTENRQAEAARLAGSSDVVLVIGSRSSSNTVKLSELCRAICPRTYLIERPEDVSAVIVQRTDHVSITAGASTPSSLIQEVKEAMSEQMENFEELLEQSFKTLNSGDIVEGVITSVSGNEVHLDLGAKATGVIVRDKLTDDPQAKLTDLFKVGDVIKAKVIKVSDIDGIATLDKTRADSESNWIKIVDAEASGEILSGKVTEITKGGVIVSIDSVKVFVPASHTGIPKDGDMNVLLGTEQKVKVFEIKKDRKRAYGSIRLVRQEERRAKEAAFWDTVEEGKFFEGPVKSLTPYGAFVDLGGVDGMVHVSELSWRRIHNPAEVVKVGDVLRVFVKSFDREKGRISLGYKTPDSDPWYVFNQKYSVGDVATVKIVSLTDFGAFAEVVPGADGLIHISQIADHKIAKPSEILSVGQEVDAKIVAVDDEKHKISLSIRALIEDVEKEAAAEAAEAEAPATFSTDDLAALASFEGEQQ